MLNRASFATVSATATRAYADASAIAISPTPNTQEAYKKLSKDIWNPTDRPVFVLYRFILRSLEPASVRAKRDIAPDIRGAWLWQKAWTSK